MALRSLATSALRPVSIVRPQTVVARSISRSAIVGFPPKSRSEPDLPLPPKQAVSSYGVFFVEWFKNNREKFLTDEGKVKVAEVSREAAKTWQGMGDEAKKSYIEQGKTNTEAYKSAYKSYYNSLTEDQITSLNAILPRPLHPPSGPLTKKARKTAQDVKEGKPPKPLTGFFQFMAEWRGSDEFKGLVQKDGEPVLGKAVWAAKSGGEKWARLSAEEKQAYADRSASVKEVYDTWKASQTKV